MPFTYNLLTSRLTQGNPVFAGGLRHCCVRSRIARCNVLPAEPNPESRDSHEESPQSSMIKVIVTHMRKGLPRQGQGELWRQIGSQAHYCNKKPMTPPEGNTTEAVVSGSPRHSLPSLFIPWSKRTLGVHLLVSCVRKIDGKAWRPWTSGAAPPEGPEQVQPLLSKCKPPGGRGGACWVLFNARHTSMLRLWCWALEA